MIVIADKPGQLGNMLLLFSHFIGRAIESGFTVSNLAFDDYAKCFPSTNADLLCRFPAKRSRLPNNLFVRRLLFRASNFSVRALSRLGGNLGFVRAVTLYDWEAQFPLNSPEFLKIVRSRRIIFVRGWGFRDAESLTKNSARIRDFFRPPEIKLRNIDELISRARQDSDTLVGVHIRHGILHFNNTRKYFYSAKRYSEMMADLVAMLPGRRVAFLICSDWPQDPEVFSRFKVTFGSGDLIEDMYGFSRCDYLIGPLSTFTMWASFYGKVPLSTIRRPDQRLNLADFIALETLIEDLAAKALEESDLVEAVSGVEPRRVSGENSSRICLGPSVEDPRPDERVSLVIPVRDEAETIQQLIDSINGQSRQPDEVIFVDGGSRDGTIDILRQACKQNSGLRLIEARKALPGQGRNIGVANALYDWIAFTDAGNRLESDWLEQLILAANSDPETGIVCGNFEPVTDSFFTECAAVAYLSNKAPRENGLVRGPFIASSLVRRDVWHAVGGFPELRAAEDLIFFEEIEKRGYKFKWAPKATVHWEMRPGLWSTFRRFLLYSCVNVWAQRQNQWHYGVARLYLLGLPFFILAGWKSAWWLLIPFAGLSVRVGRRLWFRREDRGLLWVLNPLRFAYVLIITLTLDLATFSGWFAAIVKRREATRTKNHMRTRRGD